MSKPFLLGVLVLLGVLLYVTSFALRKQTEPPAPPAPEVTKAMEDKKAEMDKESMRNSMKAQEAAAKHYNGKAGDLGFQKGTPAPKPAGQPVKDRNTMDIRSDWHRGTSDGTKGIDDEIKYRESLPAPGAGPKPVAGGGTSAPDPSKLQKMQTHQ